MSRAEEVLIVGSSRFFCVFRSLSIKMVAFGDYRCTGISDYVAYVYAYVRARILDLSGDIISYHAA